MQGTQQLGALLFLSCALLVHCTTPPECLTATNLTESWRMDISGSGIKPGGPNSFDEYACDLNIDLQWFRFTGDAGNRMLNTCPPMFSCGAMMPYWSDEPLPTEVGVKTDMVAYESWYPGHVCKFFAKAMYVMRCSHDTDYDVIYKYRSAHKKDCYQSFCGMM
ncbi:oncoprotein-induced transcript 3 protein-like [Watersipora subatra]|uniref:oncoprotein-induced transcript 3 protein-like n=1 Tax=Watersipora subatra TaxID=2589382 RepID=UPI00355BDB23